MIETVSQCYFRTASTPSAVSRRLAKASAWHSGGVGGEVGGVQLAMKARENDDTVPTRIKTQYFVVRLHLLWIHSGG
jgi:hypothetical protein